jgi:hypothetical protein
MAMSPAPGRAFGTAAEDLELAFDSPDRPALVTALLAACALPSEAAHWWQQPVNARTAALLALNCDAGLGASLPLTLRCVAAECGGRLEIELPLAALEAGGCEEPCVTVERPHADPLTLRRPTGADLRRWREGPAVDPQQAPERMLTDLRVEGEAQAGDVERAAQALADADPLVDFTVFCACPHCGHEAQREVDLEGLALQGLAARQRRLLQEVHALASRYGWTESEILAVAPARRARYLALIEELA